MIQRLVLVLVCIIIIAGCEETTSQTSKSNTIVSVIERHTQETSLAQLVDSGEKNIQEPVFEKEIVVVAKEKTLPSVINKEDTQVVEATKIKPTILTIQCRDGKTRNVYLRSNTALAQVKTQQDAFLSQRSRIRQTDGKYIWIFEDKKTVAIYDANGDSAFELERCE